MKNTRYIVLLGLTVLLLASCVGLPPVMPGLAAALVVPSSSLADFARTHWHVREPQLVQIANGVDLEASTAPARIDPLPGLDAMTGAVTVGTLARLRPGLDLVDSEALAAA